MAIYEDIINKLKKAQLRQQYNQNKQSLMQPVGRGLSNLGIKMSQSSIPALAKMGVGTQTLGNKLGALGAAKGLGNAGALGGAAGGALGKAAPVLGAAQSGAQAAQDASRGDYIGAGLNGVAAGASFVPGVGTAVAMGAQALDSINKMFRAAKDKANAKAMQEGIQAMQQNEQINAQDTAAQQQAFQDASEQAAQNMAQPSTYDAMKTQLPVGQEIGYQVAKDNSPFATDSGYDYDLRGAYQRLGGLNPEATNGHLSDYDKLPIHPTFSTDSKFYNGQDYAVNPETYSYPEEQEVGTPATATTPANNSLINKIKSMFNRGMTIGGAAALQDEPATQPQIEDVNGNVSAFPTTREGFAKSLTDNGWQQDIVDAALQGLNGGNKDMADYITAYNNNAADGQQIAIPQTKEEVELARNGQFYQPEQPNTAANATKESLFERIKNGLGQFKAGYDDNSTTGFADGDLANNLSGNAQQPVIAQNGTLTGGAATTKKTIMNRLGEAAGTGRRLMANPWVQAGLAAAISKADGGDIGDMAQAAYKYGTAKAMSDQYYRQLHPDAKVMPVLNTYGVDDYKAKAYNDFNQGRTVMSRRDLIKLQNPTMSDKDIEDLITKSGINGDELVSIKGYETVEKAKNNTRKTDIQEDKNKWQRDQGQQKIGIQQQKVNNTKINNDRNYQLKLKAAQDKVSKSDLKEQTKQELNRNLAKYSTIINDPNRSDEDKAKARQGMINTYGKDFLSVEANL